MCHHNILKMAKLSFKISFPIPALKNTVVAASFDRGSPGQGGGLRVTCLRDSCQLCNFVDHGLSTIRSAVITGGECGPDQVAVGSRLPLSQVWTAARL